MKSTDKTRPQTIFITGVGGFVGGHAAVFFLSRGWHVVGLLHQTHTLQDSTEQILKLRLQQAELLERIPSEHHAQLTLLTGDIHDRSAMQAVFQTYQPHAMLHAAALLIPPAENAYADRAQWRQAIDDYIIYNQASVLADCAASYQQTAPHFYCLLVSTIFVFKRDATEITEASARVSREDHIYGHSKQMAEQYWTSAGLRYAILYPPQIYGPDQFTPAIMPKLMQKMLFNQGDLLKLAGGVNPIHVNNMIGLMYSLCQQRIVGAFCVAGDGQSISMEDIARSLQQAATLFLEQYEMTPYRAYVVEGKAPPPLPPIQETGVI